MANAQIDSHVKAARERSDERRKAFFTEAKDRFEKSALASGSFCIGRTDDGKPADTRSVSSLNITISGWFVKTVFMRDDIGLLKGRDWRDVERDARAGDIPTRAVVSENHIITAVRELKHVREGYYSEIKATKTVVDRITALNSLIANKPHPVSDSDISNVVKGLRELRPEIEKKDGPLKQIVGLGRLDEAIRRFECVLEPECINRALELGRACAVLLSVPERLTTWRDKRIAGGVAYTTLRETSLRVERDKWVFSKLAWFSSATNRVSQYAEEDGKKNDALVRVRGMLDELDALHAPLRRLRKIEKWPADDEAKLLEARKSLESMEQEASRTPWADKEMRAGLRKQITNLERKKTRSVEESEELADAKKRVEEMKAVAMRLPWHDAAARGILRKTIRRLEEKKKRAQANAEKLDSAEKAFAEKKTEAMRCLWANSKLFAPTKDGKKPAHLSGDYSWVHRHIKNERLGEARAKLDRLSLFLNSNKPRFIFDELSATRDSYLEPVLSEMRPAVAAFESKDLRAAQRHFAQAALEMRKIVYPESR
ncbi:hypothetical protein L0Y65_02065 [Candidatus Micrarchaeota archaeon]|nr:hypothetical protein [Candidatus Micrarchaeota archaeon]